MPEQQSNQKSSDEKSSEALMALNERVISN